MTDPVHASGQGLLPEPVHGRIVASAIADADPESDSITGLPEEVEYSAFESGDRRFGWLHTPATIGGDEAQFLVIELRGSGDDWDVLDADGYDSPEDAMQAAGRVWLKENGGPEVPTEPVVDW